MLAEFCFGAFRLASRRFSGSVSVATGTPVVGILAWTCTETCAILRCDAPRLAHGIGSGLRSLGAYALLCCKRARALRCHAPKLAQGSGSGPRCLGKCSFWSLAKAPASAGAGCQAGRGRRGPLPLLAGLCFCISGWLAADSLQAFRWLQEGKALPSWPPFGGVGARMGAASTRRALGSRFAKRLARSPLFTICRDKATAVSWKMSTRNNTAASMSNVIFGVMFPGHFVSPSCMTACTGRGGIGRGRG